MPGAAEAVSELHPELRELHRLPEVKGEVLLPGAARLPVCVVVSEHVDRLGAMARGGTALAPVEPAGVAIEPAVGSTRDHSLRIEVGELPILVGGMDRLLDLQVPNECLRLGATLEFVDPGPILGAD